MKWRREGFSNSTKKMFHVRMDQQPSRYLKARGGLDGRPSRDQGLFRVVYATQDLLGIKVLAELGPAFFPCSRAWLFFKKASRRVLDVLCETCVKKE